MSFSPKLAGLSPSRVPRQVPLWINGTTRTTAKAFPVRSTLTEKTIYQCSNASVADADDALASAVMAFPLWAQTKPAARRDVFLTAADLVDKRRERLENTLREELGTSAEFARMNTATAAEMLRDAGGRLAHTLTGQIPHPQKAGQSALLYRAPYGVVLGIAPWNAPYLLGVRACLYPIAAGNTCLLKGSELSPGCFHHIGEIFHDAGLPAGVLNLLYTTRADSAVVTNHLIRAHPVRKVNFTGSSAVGALVAAEAAKSLKPALMELGGKTSAIILEDADIRLAARECIKGAFINSGQACMSTERILVARKILGPFRRALLEEVARWKSAADTPCILIQQAAVARNQRLAQDAVSKGASLLSGGPDSSEKFQLRLQPMVLEGVDKRMDIYYEESFGPLVSLYTVDTEEEAVVLANDTEYGLSCSLFTADLAKGLRLARRIDSGAIHINSMSVHDEAALPHGGQKSSGWGRFNGEWGLHEFLQSKTVTYLD
ncbi:aldehyde dehydrogenase [Aspergillus fijiensis CBS 313.89]|uniref:Putative salicylaldehyde dehydrogenase n=1 Tax=Aspergillus fijiensis CBS 313.89 TaxID=1448319 RepID=A0A8G1VTU3_9EURO|nr:putative salicylaldehyde dehydrogenase [Aspergillus fijiensis CBS 313.89]RAK71446.1 putative salicylaldehyde dehydrogenase [Aspergillus fijiensis CBS 313.89]